MRSRLRRLALTGALAALLCACGGADGDTAPARWIVLGSSTAAGVGASPDQGWAARLDAALRQRGATVDNRARSGATTWHAVPAATPRGAERPSTDAAQDVALALSRPAHALILAFPSNDAMLGYSAEETTANLLLMREQARQRGAAVVVLSSQPRADAGAPARATMLAIDAALAAEVGACFVDVRTPLADAQGRIAAAYAAGDGVHLNNAGHALVFERLWSTITAGACLTPP